ncbi:Multidrug resistance protein abc superfamily, partial [Globisporangium polare]
MAPPSIKPDEAAGAEYHRVETPRAAELELKLGDDVKPKTGGGSSTTESDDKKKPNEEDGEDGPPKRKGPPKSFNFSQLYRYATLYDK